MFINYKSYYFKDNLIVEKISNRLWKTYQRFDWIDENHYIIVPEGFITDFASVPRPFWIFLPPDGIYTQSAVLHDYLYNKKMFPRKECDRLFLEAMKALNVAKMTRTLMFWAVRLFGYIPWNEKNNG